MRRIGLYLGFPPEGGGAFQYAQSIFRSLADLPPGHYTIVVAYSHPAWQERIRSFTSTIEEVPVQERWWDSAIKLALRFGFPITLWRALAPFLHPLSRRLRRLSCDVWLFPAQDIWTYGIPVPAIGVIHDLMHRYEPEFPEVSSLGLYQRRERHYRRLCRYALAVLVDSRTGRHHVHDSYGLKNSRIHELPYVAPGYMLADIKPADFDKRYKLPGRFLFYPAQFWKHKNHLRLLEALHTLRQEFPDLHLILAGAPKNGYREVLAAIERYELGDRVLVLGYVPDEDIPEFYRRAAALVMPTFFGPTNIPPLEAMMAGCPVAISDIYGMSEQVKGAALLFDPKSTTEITEAIRRILSDTELRRHLIEAGKERARAWGQAQFNERVHTILKTVLSQ